MPDPELELRSANGRLKRDGAIARIKVDWRAKTRAVSLTAPLPPKPGEPAGLSKTRAIALGFPATVDAIRAAERLARRLSREILGGSFQWENWGTRAEKRAIADWIAEFEQFYFNRRRRTPKTLTTWEIDYYRPLKRLPLPEPLTPEILTQTLLRLTEPDTRSRQRMARAFQALADFARCPVDVRQYQGRYGPAMAAPRILPSAAEIEAARRLFKEPEWRWVYGAIAAYGLRPHEVFLARAIDPPWLEISAQSKTGKLRIAYPRSLRWFEDWELAAIVRPDCSGPNNSALGHRVTTAFRRAGCPFAPYDLRHAYAIYWLGKKDSAVIARMLGHSLYVHERIYRLWMTMHDLRRAFEE
ncbi:MAG: hypothetical protein MH825_13020 [Cyanobacteria bacterium]|nr:hypothetical protein [Cyanobacteriota bacterium]